MPSEFKDKVREQFGRTAAGYVQSKGFAGGADLEEAVRLLKPTPEDSLLDVARADEISRYRHHTG
jgi:hypothetical protein